MVPGTVMDGGSVLEIPLVELGARGKALRTERVQEAMGLAQQLYRGRLHWTGVPLLEHVAGVLRILLTFAPDEEAIIACLLHHALETKVLLVGELAKRFGPTVRSIVSGVHLLSHVTTENRRMSMDNLRLMFLRVSDDPRIVLMILCDQSEILEHLGTVLPEVRRRICQDVLDLYAPVAARLGIFVLKHRLESGAFPVVYPTDAARVSEQLQELQGQHGQFLEGAAMQLTEFLATEGVEARVEGRQKEPYSIFGKMMTKGVTHVKDVYDLFALRVIVSTPEACYQVLGLLHRIGHPLPNRFKDYIAFPKPNAYQSLHTTLAQLPGVPEGIFVEVQIRTEAMHREAEYGIAAHWSYKEGGDSGLVARRVQLTKALTFQASAEPDHIFVLTPKGDVIELPEGATPLDFAFSVHTGLGIAYKAARVNGSIAPLDHELENGDVVEILKHADPRPSPQWLQLLRTAPARARLKRYLASQQRPHYIAVGRETLNAELLKRGLQPLDPDLSVLRLFDGKVLPVAEREDLLVKIGQGSQKAASLLPHLDALKEQQPPPQRVVQQTVVGAGALPLHVEVDGDIRMPVTYARCCKPDEQRERSITGIVTRTGEVRVHRTDCRMMKGVNPERRIKVRWL